MIDVVLRAMTAAPSVLLPPFTLDPDTLPVVRIELTSPADTRLELFYESEGEPGYDWSRNLWWPLRQGRNVLLMPLPNPGAYERLRLDIGKAAGDYVLHTLEVRAIPSDTRAGIRRDLLPIFSTWGQLQQLLPHAITHRQRAASAHCLPWKTACVSRVSARRTPSRRR